MSAPNSDWCKRFFLGGQMPVLLRYLPGSFSEEDASSFLRIVLAVVGFTAEAEVHDEDIIGTHDHLLDDIAWKDGPLTGLIDPYVEFKILGRDGLVLGQDDHLVPVEHRLPDDTAEEPALPGPSRQSVSHVEDTGDDPDAEVGDELHDRS